ncbi:MAG: cell division ATPase MinD [Candidatus Aenigmatarchaeota archaeon]
MIISVVSAKGGVGKTTVVSNLSVALVKNFGKKVLAIDGNITTPTLGIHLGMLSQEKTLHDVLNGSLNLNQAVYIHPSGLHVIPSSLSPSSEYPDPEILKEKLEIVKGVYDFVFIDGAAGIGREVIAAIKASDYVLIITNPEMTSVLSAIKAIKISKFLGVPILGIVINKATKGKHELKTQDVEELCEAKVLATIPYDKKIPESIRKMMPVVLYDKKAASSRAFNSLAAQIAGEEKVEESFLEKLKKIFKFF